MKSSSKIRTVQKLSGFCQSPDVRALCFLFLLLSASCSFIFRDYLYGNDLMIFNDIGSDTWQQYIMNYTSIVNHLRDGSFSLWDFNNGLGINQFNFNLFDPFLMLLYGVGVVLGPAHMLLYINVIQILKIMVAAFAFYWFLSQFSFSVLSKMITSYAYALNGFLLVWGQHYQFGTVVIYFPLMLLFCEKFIQKKKGKALFPVMVFLCGIYSVYFTYMCLAATGLYLLFRILMLDGLTWKERIQRFLLGCAEMIMGVGMSLVVFLPMAEVLLDVSSRLESDGTGLLDFLRQCFTPYSRKFYLSMLKRMFSSNLQNGYGLAKGPQQYVMNYYEDPVLFCSTLAVFLNVQFLAVLRKADMTKRAKRVLYGVAALILVGTALPVGGTVFNYFTLPTQRYTFVLMTVFLLLMAWMWDYMRKGGKLNLVLILAVTALMGWAYWCGYEQAGFQEYRTNILILTVTGILTAVCLTLLCFLKDTQIRNVILGVMGVVLVVNVVSEGGTNYQNRVTMKKTDVPAEVMVQETQRYEEMRTSDDKEIKYRAEIEKPQDFFREMYRVDLADCLNYLKENDPTFYRVEKDYISGTVSMDSSGQGYRGISTYNSVMNGNVKEFVETCYPELFFADHNHYTFWNNVDDNWLAAFLGVKYILSGNGEPDETKYKLLDQVGSLYIHENVLDAQTAHFYTQDISEESLKELCTEENREELLGEAIALEDGTEIGDASESQTLKSEEQETAEQNSSVTLDAPQKDSVVTGSVHAEADGYALFMIPYEKGWSLTIDGEKAELLRGDIGFLACEVPEGDHTILLTFEAPGLKAGTIGSVLFWILFAQSRLLIIRKNKTRKSAGA
nr:YfhO family protein [uncultured Blautia sp.]